MTVPATSDLPTRYEDLKLKTSKIPGYEPGLPLPETSVSYWMGNWVGEANTTLGAQSALPPEAEVVIIGGGLSGALTAYWLLKGDKPPKSVVLLEAREICSGATGRNGGHCRPDCFRGYSAYKQRFGRTQALKLIKNEVDNLHQLIGVIHREKIDCDLWEGHTFDVSINDEVAAACRASYQEFKADGGDISKIDWIDDPARAKELTQSPLAVAVACFPAASLWPYKLVTALIKLLQPLGLSFHTWTPAKKLSHEGNTSVIETPRGIIKAPIVVHGTNGFCAHLLPEFSGRIAPYLAQAAMAIPTKNYRGTKALQNTYVFHRSLKFSANVFSIAQLSSGVMVLAGGGYGLVPMSEFTGKTSDEHVNDQLKSFYDNALSQHLYNWGKEMLGEGIIHHWAGTQGFTHDDIPFVGAVNGRPGNYIIAGHSGHGMARIATCSRGIARLISGEEWSALDLPDCFQPTKERVEHFTRSVQEELLAKDIIDEPKSKL